MRAHPARTAAAAVLPATGLCAASPNTFLFTVSNVISPDQPSATVTLWSAFEPQWYAFGKTHLDVVTEPDSGGLSEPILLLQDKIGTPGIVELDGDRVSDIVIMQLQWPGNIWADTSNPLAIWSATWTTDNFTPRQVPLWTEAKDYFIYLNPAGEWKDFYGIEFSQGSGLIHVVPAPACAAFLAPPALWVGRRPRRR